MLVKTFGTALEAGRGGGGHGGTVALDEDDGGDGGGGGGGGGGRRARGDGSSGAAASDRPQRPLRPAPPSQFPWFPKVRGTQAEQMLTALPEGTFFVRPSSQGPNVNALSINVGDSEVRHILLVKNAQGMVTLGQEGDIPFASEKELVEYYMKHPPVNPRFHSQASTLAFIPYSQ